MTCNSSVAPLGGAISTAKIQRSEREIKVGEVAFDDNDDDDDDIAHMFTERR